jgi:hypothetical protein
VGILLRLEKYETVKFVLSESELIWQLTCDLFSSDRREGLLKSLGFSSKRRDSESYGEVTRMLLSQWKTKLEKEKKDSYFVDS